MPACPKLGFFIQPIHPPSRQYADVLREDRQAVVLADRLGFVEAFIGEHLMDSAETITSSLAFIASLADACPSIIFRTGVLPLANYHPAMAGALDVIRDFAGQPDSELSTARCIERLVIAGTVQSVAEQILAFRSEVGEFGTLLYTGHDWADPALARRSMELMANEVWPLIDQSLSQATIK